jgi:hypothetical protein
MAGVPAVARPTGPASSFLDPASFELIQRVAGMFAKAEVVPQRFRGKVGDCVIAIDMANRLDASILQVMQALYSVHGNPSWSAKFLIASFNQCGRFSSIHYRWIGERGKDTWGCVAWATEKATGETIEGPEITIALAKSEGWYNKNGSKWQTIPQLMLMYRAAAWLVNTHAPEISMGLRTVEENEEIELEPRGDGSYGAPNGNGEAKSRSDALANRLGLKDADSNGNSDGGTVVVEQDPALVERCNDLILSINSFHVDEPDAGVDALEAAENQRDLAGMDNERLAGVEKYLRNVLAQKEKLSGAKKPAGKSEQLGLGGKSEI